MTNKTQANLTAARSADIPDNTAQEITAADMRAAAGYTLENIFRGNAIAKSDDTGRILLQQDGYILQTFDNGEYNTPGAKIMRANNDGPYFQVARYELSALLTGTDSSQWTTVQWVYMLDSATNDPITIANSKLFTRASSWDDGGTGKNNIQVRWNNSSNTAMLDATMDQDDHGITTDTWFCILASWGKTETASHVYINDTACPSYTTQAYSSDLDTDQPASSCTVGSSPTNQGNIYISDLYVTNEYIDLSVTANRRKFIDAAGKPVFCGTTGQLPTGTQALIYSSGGDLTAHDGSTSDWAEPFGTVLAAPSTPSD